jgi:transposase
VFTLIIGIDIAKRNHEATAIDDAGQILGRITFANSNAGAAKLLDFIARLKSEDEKVVFGMEATGHYWLAIYSYLVERDFDVFVINPIQSDSLRNLFIRKTKNDQRDSFIIAEIIRFGRYTETQLSDENTLALRQLCRYRTSLVSSMITPWRLNTAATARPRLSTSSASFLPLYTAPGSLPP